MCWKPCHTGVQWKHLYADDLAVMADPLEECIARFMVWKEEMKHRGLKVNMKKTKIMVSDPGLDLHRDSGAFPCIACRSGVGASFVDHLCYFCLVLLCFHARLFVDALRSPAGKGLTSLLSFVMSNCDIVTFPLVSLFRRVA